MRCSTAACSFFSGLKKIGKKIMGGIKGLFGKKKQAAGGAMPKLPKIITAGALEGEFLVIPWIGTFSSLTRPQTAWPAALFGTTSTQKSASTAMRTRSTRHLLSSAPKPRRQQSSLLA